MHSDIWSRLVSYFISLISNGCCNMVYCSFKQSYSVKLKVGGFFDAWLARLCDDVLITNIKCKNKKGCLK